MFMLMASLTVLGLANPYPMIFARDLTLRTCEDMVRPETAELESLLGEKVIDVSWSCLPMNPAQLPL